MALDLSKFHQTFFEECAENLDGMEAALLGLAPGADNTEAIHTIFRGAHSIKGGAATFAFEDIASFTHTLETLLDRIRDGRRALQHADVDLLLQCVDALREMLAARRDGGRYDSARVHELEARLKHALQSSPTTPAALPAATVEGEQSLTTAIAAVGGADQEEITEEEFEALLDQLHGPGGVPGAARHPPEAPQIPGTGAPQEITEAEFEKLLEALPEPKGAPGVTVAPAAGRTRSSADRTWRIVFRPHVGLLRSGNDPARIFRELASLGPLEVTAELGALPAFAAIDPEGCYLAWNLQLQTPAPRERIAEAFAWVEGECALAIEELPSAEEAASMTLPKTTANAHTIAEPANVPTTTSMSEAPSAEATNAAASVPAAATPERAAASGTEAASIRVSIDKIDALINMVSELVITQSMLSQIGEHFDLRDLPRLQAGLAQLARNTRELQESVMRIRMLPIGFVFHRLPRLVHDLSAKLGKKVELKISGEQTELDKTVLERIGDPLVHLVRNALDHGIESPERRRAAGKPEHGTLQLNAYHQSGHIVIEVSDDGAGLSKDKILAKARQRGLVKDEAELSDERIYELVFLPGFSTAEEVSEISGRGVGMDVVRRNIKALGGSIEIRSQEGRGTTLTIRLPLTLAIVDGQTVRVGGEIYIIPLVSIVETVRIQRRQVNVVAGRAEVVHLRGEYLPLLRLTEVLGTHSQARCLEEGLLVVVEGEGRRAGLFVDELLGQQQVVIKSLEANFARVAGIAGATILGDGSVALILDVPELIRLAPRHFGGGLPPEEIPGLLSPEAADHTPERRLTV